MKLEGPQTEYPETYQPINVLTFGLLTLSELLKNESSVTREVHRGSANSDDHRVDVIGVHALLCWYRCPASSIIKACGEATMTGNGYWRGAEGPEAEHK